MEVPARFSDGPHMSRSLRKPLSLKIQASLFLPVCPLRGVREPGETARKRIFPDRRLPSFFFLFFFFFLFAVSVDARLPAELSLGSIMPLNLISKYENTYLSHILEHNLLGDSDPWSWLSCYIVSSETGRNYNGYVAPKTARRAPTAVLGIIQKLSTTLTPYGTHLPRDI